MRPTLLLRIILFYLAWRARKKGANEASSDEVLPTIPLSSPSAFILKQIRRSMGRPSFPQKLSSLRIRKWITIKIPTGDGVLREARLYRPRGQVSGVVLFLHGGGFVHCDLVSHHGICCRLAAASKAMVVSLDYRLAPEYRFPLGLNDAKGALSWLMKVAPHIPIAVAGDSAGGNLAAVLAQWNKREKHPQTIKGQLLYYPALSGPISPLSRERYANGYMLTKELLYWYCGQTLNSYDELFDPSFSPVFADDFESLPPAMIVTAGFDPLRGEGDLYTQILRQAGVKVRHRNFPRMIHGFLNGYALLRDGRRALREGGEFLKECFSGHG
ncbi:alpha/beta hydrolase [Swingsia samuiensis]|uniref:Alpha/beta hydrolase n=1 Tax=Swingsia samuiensis TaxID=1293412 RepID=A0A4Y6UJT7_9PROT|nr:alpha/beta hydrolase [Swingsia samuiensis]QDH16265.1 alpha/beta hydrolase [Swingsia samuiensis]